MSLNIQTSTGLLEISTKVTKDKVISALGYSPANEEIETTVDNHIKDTDAHITSDERELWTENVENLDSHKSDKTVHVTSTEKQTWNNKSDFSGAYADLIDAPNITENDSGNMVIADESGNVIMQVDSDGITTTNVDTKSIELNGEDLGSRIDRLESISLPNIVDNESGDLTIADEDGNAIVKINENGLETTTVTAKSVIVGGVDVTAELDELNEHVSNTTSHITAAERTAWNAKATTAYVDEAVAELVNSAPDKLNTLDELAAALGDDENFANTVTTSLSKKATKTDLESHTGNQSNPHKVTKTQVGLGNVDNTSDANKPVSTAQQEALNNLKTELSESIVSESKEWTVADNDGNIVLTVDADGLETTTITAKSVVVNGADIESVLDNIDSNIANIKNGNVTVAKATHADSADIATEANHASSADTATSATSATKATQDGNGKVIADTYETKADANTKLNEAKSYADSVGSGKANTSHNHVISDITNLQSALDEKANSTHSHTITASASDDDVIVLTGTNGTNKVAYSASHANSGVTAGTYKSVTVDVKGHVTGGSNPTTLSGYGITDVYTKTQVDSTVSNLQSALDSKVSKEYVDELIGGLSGGTDATSVQAALNAHIANKSNPHEVTLSQLGVTATATELNYVGGVTSSIQTQLNTKATLSDLNNYYTKAQIDDMVLITVEDIDAICGVTT